MTRGSAIDFDRRARLREIRGVRQEAGAPLRRWFTCASADLYLWQEGREVTAFEFCWGKPRDERLLRWSRAGERLHARVDDGEQDARANRSPVLAGGLVYDAQDAALAFERVGGALDAPVYRLLLRVLLSSDDDA